mgnify:CR=1 FL=1
MKKHIALGICVLIFLITGGCSFIMPQSGENGYGGGISSTEKDGKNVSENENITFRVLDGKEISYQQLKSLSPDDLLHDVWEILPESTNLESKFGSKAKKGIWVLASKKNPSYLEEFEKKLAEN